MMRSDMIPALVFINAEHTLRTIIHSPSYMCIHNISYTHVADASNLIFYIYNFISKLLFLQLTILTSSSYNLQDFLIIQPTRFTILTPLATQHQVFLNSS